MTPQIRITEVTGAGYPSRECRRSDCCDNCLHIDDCTLLMRRCFPRGELREQCETCKPCKSFIERPRGTEYRTALEILREGPLA